MEGKSSKKTTSRAVMVCRMINMAMVINYNNISQRSRWGSEGDGDAVTSSAEAVSNATVCGSSYYGALLLMVYCREPWVQ